MLLVLFGLGNCDVQFWQRIECDPVNCAHCVAHRVGGIATLHRHRVGAGADPLTRQVDIVAPIRGMKRRPAKVLCPLDVWNDRIAELADRTDQGACGQRLGPPVGPADRNPPGRRLLVAVSLVFGGGKAFVQPGE